MTTRCEVTGCKHEARWAAHKLFGKGGTIRVCDEHRPGSSKSRHSLGHATPFYDVRPITTRRAD